MLPFAAAGRCSRARCWLERIGGPGGHAVARPARPAPGRAARARRLVRRRGGRAEPVQGDRPPLLRLGARAPAPAAMAGAGAVAFGELARRRAASWASGADRVRARRHRLAQVVLMHREHYMHVVRARAVAGGAALAFVRCAAAPAGRAGDRAGVRCCCSSRRPPTPPPPGSRPSRAPSPPPARTPSPARVGSASTPHDLRDRPRAARLLQHPPSRLALGAVDESPRTPASPLILLGLDAGRAGRLQRHRPRARRPAPGAAGATRQARYVLLGGEYSAARRQPRRPTADAATPARQLAPSQWHSPVHYPDGLVLFDCAGRTRAAAPTEPSTPAKTRAGWPTQP